MHSRIEANRRTMCVYGNFAPLFRSANDVYQFWNSHVTDLNSTLQKSFVLNTSTSITLDATPGAGLPTQPARTGVWGVHAPYTCDILEPTR